jgi:predicted ester cyclase
MKKIIFIAAIGLAYLFYSCNTPAPSNATAGGMDTASINRMKNLNVEFYQGFEKGDFSLFDTSNVMPNVIDHGMGPKDVIGIDSVKKGLSTMTSEIKDIKFEILAQGIDGNYSMVYNRITGTSASPASGFPVGTAIDMLNIDVLRWDNGKVAEHWGYIDPRDMMKMMPPSSMPMEDKTKH